MPTISDDYLTVLNLFTADGPENQDRLIGAMRQIVDNAAYEGWVSSTVHSGVDKLGTANFIQWRSHEDVEARYAGDEFKQRLVPLFNEIATSIRLLQTEVAFVQQRPALGSDLEISPGGDDYTLIEVFGVGADDQDELVSALGPAQDWLLDTPGYRGHTVLRGVRARGLDGAFVATYAQWDDKESYDAFRVLPEADQSPDRRKIHTRIGELTTFCDWNTYRVVHSRSAGQ